MIPKSVNGPDAKPGLSGFHRFVAVNKACWQPLPHADQKLLVSVNCSPSQLVTAGLLIRALAVREKLEPVIFLDDSPEQEVTKALFESFGVRSFLDISDLKLKWWQKRMDRLRCLWLKMWALLNLEAFLDRFVDNYCYHKIRVGDLLYDHFIRQLQNYHLWPKNFKDWNSHLKEHFLSCDLHLGFYRSHPFKGVVVSDPIYATSGSYFLRTALHSGHKVWSVNGLFVREYQEPDDADYGIYRVSPRTVAQAEFPPDWETEMNEYLHNRFSGLSTEVEVQKAYGAKAKHDRASLLRVLGLPEDENRKLIFIMPHCFSDANNAYRGHLFRDYFQWYTTTLEQMTKITNVVWVVRPHPTASHYGEDGIAEHYFRKSERAHVRMAPANMSTATVFEFASAVITVNGTIGAEASAMGLPAIITANAPYDNHGFTLQPRTREEYFKMLNSMDTIQPLTAAQILTARKVLYVYHLLSRPKSRVIKSSFIPGGTPYEEQLRLYDISYGEMADELESSDGWQKDIMWLAIQKMVNENRPLATQPIAPRLVPAA